MEDRDTFQQMEKLLSGRRGWRTSDLVGAALKTGDSLPLLRRDKGVADMSVPLMVARAGDNIKKLQGEWWEDPNDDPGESSIAEAWSSSHRTKAADNRQRQKENKTLEENREDYRLKPTRSYMTALRTAFATYIRLPSDY